MPDFEHRWSTDGEPVKDKLVPYDVMLHLVSAVTRCRVLVAVPH